MVITADRRTEWSYRAALLQALDDSPQAAPAITLRCQGCGHDTRFMRSELEPKPLPRAVIATMKCASGPGTIQR